MKEERNTVRKKIEERTLKNMMEGEREREGGMRGGEGGRGNWIWVERHHIFSMHTCVNSYHIK